MGSSTFADGSRRAGGSAESAAPPAEKQSAAARPTPLYPQLRARRNASREAVAAHQRGRLHAAMVEACAESGYAAATANRVVSLAGVSTKTLYKHFESKEECFLSTYDLVVREAVARISTAYRVGAQAGPAIGLCHAFDAFAKEFVERPKRSRLALVDVLAAGPDAFGRIERAEAVFARMIEQSLSRGAGTAPEPLLVRSFVGGIWFVARARLLEDRPEAISGCGHELYRWILSYRTPGGVSLPRTAPVPPSRRTSWEAVRDEGQDDRTRMLRAALRLAVDGGYAGLTSGQIAELAEVDAAVFGAEFGDPGDCFLTGFELLTTRVLGRALGEGDDAPSWPAAVCRTMRALLQEVAQDRVFARTAFVEVFAAGSAGIERRATLLRSFAAALARRAPRERQPSPVVAEAIVGAIWSIARRHVAHDRAAALPSLSAHASFLALAPVIGAERAREAVLSELA